MSTPSNSPIAFSANGVTQTVGPYRLTAGKFQFAGVATSWTGQTATLEMLGPDAATYVPLATGLTGNAVTVLDLPDGQYQVALATTSEPVSVSVVRVGGGGPN